MNTSESFSTEFLNAVAPKNNVTETTRSKKYGSTIGKPELSDKAAEYYSSLKEKYSNMEFVLVDNDSVETAEQQASKYMSSGKTVVLVDAARIEEMASDESVRNKFEGLIENSVKQLEDMKNTLAANGADVKGFGIRINDDGTSSFFAVIDKSLEQQKERIEKQQKEHHEDRIKELRNKDVSAMDIISASSIEELIERLSDYTQNSRMNQVKTKEETYVGQSIDFKL